jgi:hypothetical protein
VTDAPEGADLEYIFEAIERVQCYSRPVQVFAAMVVEATLDTYGLFRLGEETFERQAAYAGPAERVRILLESVPATFVTDIKEIVRIVDRLACRRNALVHPRGELSLMDEMGTFRSLTARRPVPINLDTAHTASADMECFLKRFGALLEKHHVEAAVLLHLA